MQAEIAALWEIYSPSEPPLLAELAATPPMQRLRQVGMNCGCEYTAFPCFSRLLPYSRYTHSVGVGRIVWRFTGSEMQAAAGLLHDIATPTFSHVVDFLRGDHMQQEATEDGTRQLIDGSPELRAVLRAHGLTTDAVCDYHRYPIADNDSPRLSADRLEYTLGNLLNFHFGTLDEARTLYEAVCVTANEDGAPELAFADAGLALRFAEIALRCARVYISDEDRYAMQLLSELLRDALAAGALAADDLMTDEPRLLEKLCARPEWARRWAAFRAMSRMERAQSPDGVGWRRIDAKRRCIDPLVCGQGRVTALFPDFGRRLTEFRTAPLNAWLRANGAETVLNQRNIGGTRP